MVFGPILENRERVKKGTRNRLPDMSGPEVSQILKQDEGTRNIPTLLITASIDEIELKAKEFQAAGYKEKNRNGR